LKKFINKKGTREMTEFQGWMVIVWLMFIAYCLSNICALLRKAQEK